MEFIEALESSGSERSRIKSSHRLHYEAQVEVIQKQTGDLESVREKLGLSQRKMAHLLMVDPSAWTRWTKNGEKAPPHIYRALQWYLIMNEKIPGLTPQYFIGKDPEILHQSALKQIKQESLQRHEFEEALSLQTFRMEKLMEELQLQNQDLLGAKAILESEVEQLKAATLYNRVGFFLMAIGGLIFACGIYWRFLRF